MIIKHKRFILLFLSLIIATETHTTKNPIKKLTRAFSRIFYNHSHPLTIAVNLEKPDVEDPDCRFLYSHPYTISQSSALDIALRGLKSKYKFPSDVINHILGYIFASDYHTAPILMRLFSLIVTETCFVSQKEFLYKLFNLTSEPLTMQAYNNDAPTWLKRGILIATYNLIHAFADKHETIITHLIKEIPGDHSLPLLYFMTNGLSIPESLAIATPLDDDHAIFLLNQLPDTMLNTILPDGLPLVQSVPMQGRLMTYLLGRGANPTLSNSEGTTLFHKAARLDFFHNLLKKIVELRWNTHITDAQGNIPLVIALSTQRSTKNAQLLLDLETPMKISAQRPPIKLDITDNRRTYLLAQLTHEKQIEIEYLIRDEYHQILLCHLLQNHVHDDALRLLNMNTIQVNMYCEGDKDKETPLFYAILNAHPSLTIIKALLDKKADPNIVNRFGLTPLHKAILHLNLPEFYNHDKSIRETQLVPIFELLLQYGANPHKKTSSEHTAYSAAVLHETYQLLELFKKHEQNQKLF